MGVQFIVKNAVGGGDDDEHFQKIQNEKDAIDLV